ncbi:MAG: hypothetical protein R3F33_09955 [Planctomycetota bacterium]
MSNFLSCAAVLGRSVSEVAECLIQVFERYRIQVRVLSGPEADPEKHVTIYPAGRKKTLILWPAMCLWDMGVVRHLSTDLDAVLSVIQIYDSEHWDHLLFVRGEIADQFRNKPLYWMEDESEEPELLRKWAGNAELLAAHLGAPAGTIAPYLVNAAILEEEDAEEPVRAQPDDEFDLLNEWVFVDFWRRIGIDYPEGDQLPAKALALPPGAERRLPKNVDL